MKITIPYTFKSGKKAVAAEVNTNFQTCADGIEQVAEELENVKDLSNLTEVGQNIADTVKDQNNGNRIKTWTGTKAEYDVIVTKDNNTLYNIIDDSDITFQLLELIYPVGSIYIGTMSVCPLQVLGLGTWQLVAQDMVLQGAGTKGVVKTELPQNIKLPNITGTFSPWAEGSRTATGAFYVVANNQPGNNQTGDNDNTLFGFDASRSSSVYSGDGTDTEIQQSAYLVNIWERIPDIVNDGNTGSEGTSSSEGSNESSNVEGSSTGGNESNDGSAGPGIGSDIDPGEGDLDPNDLDFEP